nr:Rid family hydrolase [Jannaschia sp. Os4]
MPLSPVREAGGLAFVTGMTGSGRGGMPEGAEAQVHAALDKIEAALATVGLGLADVVDATTFHAGLDAFDPVERAWRGRFAPPYPAWTAVGVAALRRPGALVEIKVIAAR